MMASRWFFFFFFFVKDGPVTWGYNTCWPKALMTLGSNLGVKNDQMKDREVLFWWWDMYIYRCAWWTYEWTVPGRKKNGYSNFLYIWNCFRSLLNTPERATTTTTTTKHLEVEIPYTHLIPQLEPRVSRRVDSIQEHRAGLQGVQTGSSSYTLMKSVHWQVFGLRSSTNAEWKSTFSPQRSRKMLLSILLRASQHLWTQTRAKCVRTEVRPGRILTGPIQPSSPAGLERDAAFVYRELSLEATAEAGKLSKVHTVTVTCSHNSTPLIRSIILHITNV